MFTQGEFHSPPRPALPLRSSECLLTHPEKASIMARRLPPPAEFRGAGPAGRRGAEAPGPSHWMAGSCSTPLRGWPAASSPPFPSPCRERKRGGLCPDIGQAGMRGHFALRPPEGSRTVLGEDGGAIRGRLRRVRGSATPSGGRSSGKDNRAPSPLALSWPNTSPSGRHGYVARAPRRAPPWERRGPPTARGRGAQALLRPAPSRGCGSALSSHGRCTARTASRAARAGKSLSLRDARGATARRGAGIACGPATRAPPRNWRVGHAGVRSLAEAGVRLSQRESPIQVVFRPLGPAGRGAGALRPHAAPPPPPACLGEGASHNAQRAPACTSAVRPPTGGPGWF